MVSNSRKAGAHSTPSSKVSAVVTHRNVGESKKLAETSAPFFHHLAQFGCQNHELLKSGSNERYWQLQLSVSPEFSSCKFQMHSVGSKRVFGAAGMVVVVVVLTSIAYCALIKKVLVTDFFFWVQMVSCCQRRGVRVLCSGRYHFLLCHLYSTRSPQFLPHGLAYFPYRLCKHLLTHTS